MNIIAIIQARMSSSRLPKKVLLPLADKPVLEHVVNRLRYCKTFKNIIVATSIHHSDEPIVNFCKKNNINFFRGSLNDVLDRYYQAATIYKADIIVRITADCPVIDPQIVDEVVKGFLSDDYDLYGLSGSFPDGLDCQVFKYSALKKAWNDSILPSDREHVGSYIEKTRPDLFKIGGLEKFKNLESYRWTLDQHEDYVFLNQIFSNLYKQDSLFLTNDILKLLDSKPKLKNINSNIIRNEGYLKSIQRD